MPGNADDGLFAAYRTVVETRKPWTTEHHYEHEGLDHWFLITAVPLDDGFTVTFRDVSEIKRLQVAAARNAVTDSLTGLANRAGIDQAIEQTCEDAGGASVAVVFIDIDRFKVVNDALGHRTGDNVLVTVARRLSAALEGLVVEVGRFGGDGFVAVAKVDRDDAVARSQVADITDAIARVLRDPVVVASRQLPITASVGVAIANDSDHAKTLLADADAAMYAAKRNGGAATVISTDDDRKAAVDRIDVELRLRAALQSDQFRVHYQPIVNANDQRAVGAEALVRWQHPINSLVAPAAFLDVAEEIGLIGPIGEFVLEEAVRQLADWRHTLGEDAPQFVSVNVSASQLTDPDLVDRIIATLDSHQLAGPALAIEVTETSLIRYPDDAERTLGRLSAHGVRIALDDFGTGRSPLSYLQRFHVDAVKIDRSFMKDLDGDDPEHFVAAAAICLAHKLGKSVVAEGVETPTQAQRLIDMATPTHQGFLYSRPVDPETFARSLAHSPTTR